MDEELKHDRRLRTALWDYSPIPQAIVSTDGKFRDVNPAWTELLGYSRQELLGKHFGDITHPADVDADKAEVRQIIQDDSETGYSMVKRYLSKQGTVVWVELHVIAIRRGDSSLEYFAVCVIPLPSVDGVASVGGKNNGNRNIIGDVVVCIRNNPRVVLGFCILALIATGKIPSSIISDAIKHILNP